LRGRELDPVRARIESADVSSEDDIDTVVALGLRGWRGLPDSSGTELPFPARVRADVFGAQLEVVPAATMARLPLTIADKVELLRAILIGNQLGGDDAKKSSSPRP
jgi:hypothetical protein